MRNFMKNDDATTVICDKIDGNMVTSNLVRGFTFNACLAFTAPLKTFQNNVGMCRKMQEHIVVTSLIRLHIMDQINFTMVIKIWLKLKL